jgi:RNA 3'-terminal phosphate cyclase
MHQVGKVVIEINGSHGEGGGQILRTALALSLVTQRAFTLTNIRAGRAKPGLMRQHLACVQAACAIAPGARATAVDGAPLGLGATSLVFTPAPVRPGEYCFDIGSAGSTMLADVERLLNWPSEQLHNRALRSNEGPGAVLMLHAEFEHAQELVSAYAERGVSAERVAQAAVKELQSYMAHTAPVGEHLADQLMLPLALSDAGGAIRCTTASSHTQTNLHTIEAFLPGALGLKDLGGDGYLLHK